MNWEISNRHSTGWAPFHNGNRPKPICGMAKHRSPLPTMAEFQISRLQITLPSLNSDHRFWRFGEDTGNTSSLKKTGVHAYLEPKIFKRVKGSSSF